jgi:hypothetical protein
MYMFKDYLPLKFELQEKTLEQKRNSYWELVNEYYTQTYLDAHHDTLRQVIVLTKARSLRSQIYFFQISRFLMIYHA